MPTPIPDLSFLPGKPLENNSEDRSPWIPAATQVEAPAPALALTTYWLSQGEPVNECFLVRTLFFSFPCLSKEF